MATPGRHGTLAGELRQRERFLVSTVASTRHARRYSTGYSGLCCHIAGFTVDGELRVPRGVCGSYQEKPVGSPLQQIVQTRPSRSKICIHLHEIDRLHCEDHKLLLNYCDSKSMETGTEEVRTAMAKHHRKAAVVAGAGSVPLSGTILAPAAAASNEDPVIVPSDPSNIEDVPDVSAEWYLDISEFAHSTPTWLQEFAALFTEAVVILFVGILLLAWWRARKHSDRTMARVLLAPVGVVVAYLVSEYLKTIVEAPRPCHTFQRIDAIAACPPVSDWSFPSNHATIAGAVAIGVLIAWPRIGIFTTLLAALGAFSRVFVDVHYPHDVIVGFFLGTFVASIVILSLLRLVTIIVERLRRHRTLGVVLAAKGSGSDVSSRSAVVRNRISHDRSEMHIDDRTDPAVETTSAVTDPRSAFDGDR